MSYTISDEDITDIIEMQRVSKELEDEGDLQRAHFLEEMIKVKAELIIKDAIHAYARGVK